ncbi:MAG: SDR family NAD(P)-dependent oxidoreductase [Magnetococcales bacterium]|nr:SDR family NAD(P)-dependent oxidoreductase [Magnetococcales bacterium]
MKLWRGIKLGLGLAIAFPFILALIPLWYVHALTEKARGREPHPPPWADLMPRRWRQARQERERAQERHRLAESAPPPKVAPVPESTPSTAPHPTLPTPPPDLDAPGGGGMALVTGGGKRLGAVICRELAALGYFVVIGYFSSRFEAEQLAEEIRAAGGRAVPHPLDLHQAMMADSLFNDLERTFGPLRLLVNNASVFLPTSAETGAWGTVDEILRINLLAPFWLTMIAARRMAQRQEGGQVINLGDLWGDRPLSGYSAYSVSQAGLDMATRSLAREFAPRVRINAIAPGAALPPEEGQEAKGYHRMLSRTPLAVHAGPEAVARAVRYLVGAEFVTGEILRVDGGRGLV